MATRTRPKSAPRTLRAPEPPPAAADLTPLAERVVILEAAVRRVVAAPVALDTAPAELAREAETVGELALVLEATRRRLARLAGGAS